MDYNFFSKMHSKITSFELKKLPVISEKFFAEQTFLNNKIWQSCDNNLCKYV